VLIIKLEVWASPRRWDDANKLVSYFRLGFRQLFDPIMGSQYGQIAHVISFFLSLSKFVTAGVDAIGIVRSHIPGGDVL